MTKIHFKTRTEQVLEHLKEEILSGNLKSGQPLRQSFLAEQYQVSRIPIREALLQLEAQGLVKMVPHKGAVVTEISAEEIDELFHLRSVLEPHILKIAIPKMDQHCFNLAESILVRMEQSLSDVDNVEQWSAINYEFHQCLYACADLPHTLDLINTLNTRCDRYIRLQLLYTDGIDKAQHEHRKLLDLCKRNEVNDASKFLSQHILEAGHAIKSFLKQ